jgi:hypothetical protein
MMQRLLLLVLIALSPFIVYAQNLLNTSYKPGFSKGKIKTFLNDIKKRTGITISYSDAILNDQKVVSLEGTERTVAEVLERICAGQGVQIREGVQKILVVPVRQEVAATEQQRITLSGFIKDSASKEVLIGASVYIKETGSGTIANTFGFYSITLPAGHYTMVVSYVGYKPEFRSLDGSQSIRSDILLSTDAAMEEVEVKDKQGPPDNKHHLKEQDIRFYTSLLGDNDLLKALQHLPGVQPGADGTSNLIVRGGDPGQNLNILDGVPLYYTDHFYGITSIFNIDAIKTVDFYSADFPARFGGRLSSIIDVNTRDGDMEQWGGVVNLGLLNGSLNLNGPLIKNKASALLTARRSWLDLPTRIWQKNVRINFYDVNAKLNYQINDNNRIHLSIYNGNDHFGIVDDSYDMRANWGNTFVALKWNKVISPKLFLNTVGTYSRYMFTLQDKLMGQPDTLGNLPMYRYKGITRVSEQSLRSYLFWYISPQHKVEAGLKYAATLFDPASISYPDGNVSGINTGTANNEFASGEATAYLEDEWNSNKFRVRAGLHWANWFSSGFRYSSLQPRLFVSWKASEQWSVQAAFSKMTQFLHLISNNTAGYPIEFWGPSTANILPESSLLSSAGIKWHNNKGWRLSMEVYHKYQQNLVTYRSNRNIFENTDHWESTLTQGKGWSYGAEWLIRKESERFTASVAYTLSKSMRQYEQINYGMAFPYRYDRRHNFHIDALYRAGKQINVTAGWTYMSGEAITLPDQVYPDLDNNLLNYMGKYGYTFEYSSWNDYRLPSIHRLDLAVNFHRKRGRWHRILSLGIYNAYGRRNLVGTILREDEEGKFQFTGVSIGRFIPTISYRMEF